jgi:homoserine kinase type II
VSGAPDLDAILDVWALPRPRAFAPTEGGYQNLTRYVSCAAGEFVLRVHTNVTDPARQRFEHALLRRLADAELSFALPRPLPSDNGDTLRVVDGHVAALWARIPGAPLPKDGGAHVTKAAAALAELDLAMGQLERFDARPAIFDGDPRHVHPLVTDVESALADSGLTASQQRELGDAIARTMDLVGPLYASLPLQVTHGDFAFGNTLVADGRVIGLLDFEHAGVDVRAMDLAVALYRFPAHPGTLGAIGECERFGRAYCSLLPLDVTELAALPALLLVRGALGFTHWVGRYRSGVATLDDVRPRAERALFTSEWVDRHGEELVRNALDWIGERV